MVLGWWVVPSTAKPSSLRVWLRLGTRRDTRVLSGKDVKKVWYEWWFLKPYLAQFTERELHFVAKIEHRLLGSS